MSFRILFLIALATIAPGCVDGGDPAGPGDESTDGEASAWDAFVAANAAPLPGGGYLFQRDVRVSEERLRQIFARSEAVGRRSAVHHEGVDAIWNPAQKLAITYCVHDEWEGRLDDHRVRELLRDASLEWEQAADVNFIHLAQSDGPGCQAGVGGVVFDVRMGLPSECGFGGCPLGSAFFPNDPTFPPELLLWPEVFDLDDDQQRRIVRHELGHVLGLYHEHARFDQSDSLNWACALADDNPTLRGLTPADPTSVMGYPHCEGSEGPQQELSAYDRLGVRYLYGLPRLYGRNEVFNFAGDYSNDIFWYVPGGQWTLYTATGTRDIRFGATDQCDYDGGSCQVTLPFDGLPIPALWRNDLYSASVMLYGKDSQPDLLLHNQIPEDAGFAVSGEPQGGFYVPLAGRFHGTESADIFWYSPDQAIDPVWHPNGDGTHLTTNLLVTGYYDPVVGRFTPWVDGPRDEIVWRDPMSDTGHVWTSGAIDDFEETAIDFADRGVETGAPYIPVVGDFDGDKIDDLFWFGPDEVRDVMWISNGSMTDVDVIEYPMDSRLVKPVAGDFDGNGTTDILWHAPDSHRESIWLFRAAGGYDEVSLGDVGDHAPIVGQFNSADHCADILWYVTPTRTLSPWRSRCDGTFETQPAIDVPAAAYPVGYGVGH